MSRDSYGGIYGENNQGPYTVWIQDKRKQDGDRSSNGAFSAYKVGKMILDKHEEIDYIEKENKRRAEVVLKSREAANKLVEDQSLDHENFEYIIPPFRISRKGIIRGIDVDITEDEILSVIESPVRVLSAKRIQGRNKDRNQQNENVWIPTKAVILTFEGQSLPHEIALYKIKNELRPYVATPLMCNKCFKPGHIAKYCKAELKCYRCGKDNHGEERCQAERPQCINCQGEHYSNDKRCSTYKKELEIRRLMAFENISFARARNLVYGEFGHRPNLSKENFPSLAKNRQNNKETYSNIIQNKKTNQNTRIKEIYGIKNAATTEKGNLRKIETETAKYLLELSQSMEDPPQKGVNNFHVNGDMAKEDSTSTTKTITNQNQNLKINSNKDSNKSNKPLSGTGSNVVHSGSNIDNLTKRNNGGNKMEIINKKLGKQYGISSQKIEGITTIREANTGLSHARELRNGRAYCNNNKIE